MAKKSSAPLVVLDLVSERLGRPAAVRTVKNSRHQHWILDPVFAALNRASRSAQTGYRAGYLVDTDAGELWLRTVHAPVLARIFRENLTVHATSELLVHECAAATACLRHRHILVFDSRKRKGLEYLDGESWEEFSELLQAKFSSRDLFPVLKSCGHNSDEKARVRGNTFYLLLAEFSDSAKEYEQIIEKAVHKSWPLFLAFYPHVYQPGRLSDLRRSLDQVPIEKCCEVELISKIPSEISSLSCKGEIQAAHIKPYWAGGNDRPENGIWLCARHHKATEGRIRGRRVGPEFKDVSVEWND